MWHTFGCMEAVSIYYAQCVLYYNGHVVYTHTHCYARSGSAASHIHAEQRTHTHMHAYESNAQWFTEDSISCLKITIGSGLQCCITLAATVISLDVPGVSLMKAVNASLLLPHKGGRMRKWECYIKSASLILINCYNYMTTVQPSLKARAMWFNGKVQELFFCFLMLTFIRAIQHVSRDFIKNYVNEKISVWIRRRVGICIYIEEAKIKGKVLLA